MDALICEILTRVQNGELSEVEAEHQYEQAILKQQAQKEAVNSQSQNKAIYTRRSVELIKPCDAPECRLFLFLPFGFGNETVSWAWKNAFKTAHNVEVWVIGADDINQWSDLVENLSEAMRALCDLPFVVYGHSMGGIVAYEVLVALEQKYQLSPEVFIPSSVPPPRVFERLNIMAPFYNISKDMGMEECRQLLERSQIILPLNSGVKSMSDEAMQCDIDLIKSYKNVHNKTDLSCPLFALQANNDILVKDPISVSLWKDYSVGDFFFQEIEGTHLYFMNPPTSIFSSIQSFLEKRISAQQSTFEPKVYRLLSFKMGTQEVGVYPYGLAPKGYLIYQSDGKMAAHIWNVARENNEPLTQTLSDERSIEMALSYLSYTGSYQENNGLISHTVDASCDPNFVDDTLVRYYRANAPYMTLTTAPLTTKNHRQSKCNTHGQLEWQEVDAPAIYSGHPLIGAWNLSSYNEDGLNILGDAPKGILILTEQGYFSMVGVASERSKPMNDNFALASNQEIIDAIKSSRSICGRFEINDDISITCFIEAGISDPKLKAEVMSYDLTDSTLKLIHSAQDSILSSIVSYKKKCP